MARGVWCALVVLALQCAHAQGWGRGGVDAHPRLRKLAGSSGNVVLHSHLIHRDDIDTNISTAKSPSERFLEGVKRSHRRVSQMEKSLTRQGAGVGTEATGTSMVSEVSAGDGSYVMGFSLGTPPQKFIAIVDTGSDLCWVQCSPCTRCYQQPDALFNPAASSTYSSAGCSDPLCTVQNLPGCSAQNTCTYTYMYGDGSSTRGDIAYETVTLDSSVAHIGFGCGRNQGGSFEGSDGLIGLGQGPLSLPSQLSPAVPKIFSYCLVDRSSVGTGTSSPITFGDAAANSAAKYTPLVANAINPTYYFVGVEGISVAGQRMAIPASAFQITANGLGGTILDSGTTITYWLSAAFTPLLAEFRRVVTYPEANADQYGLNLCYDVSGVDVAKLTFPAMTVHFTNVDFEIPVENLWVYVDTSMQTVCLAMSSSQQIAIIGNIQQQNYLIVHDSVNQRVGFLPTQCDTL